MSELGTEVLGFQPGEGAAQRKVSERCQEDHREVSEVRAEGSVASAGTLDRPVGAAVL